MAGGADDDLYYVDSANDVIDEALSGGLDTVRSSASTYTLADNLERLILTGSALDGFGNDLANLIVGSNGSNELGGGLGDDILYGRGGIDTLIGGDGNDTLDGGADRDILQGGAGDDTYYIATADADQVTELDGGGYDTVRVSGNGYVLADHVEALVLLGATQEGTGNALDNMIMGSNSGNQLYGAGGDDRIMGRGAGDTIDGEDGDDILLGGADADTLIGGDGNDRLDGGGGDDQLIGGAGIDRMFGREGRDVFHFSAGDSSGDRFDGGSGADSLLVGIQRETDTTFDLTTGNFLSIDGIAIYGTGNTVVLGSGIMKTADYDQNLTTGDLAIVLAPGAEDIVINADSIGIGEGSIVVVSETDGDITVIGTFNDDTIEAGSGDDDLFGGEGNDRLAGAGGDDILNGAGGQDLFVFAPLQAGNSTIVDFEAGDRIDLIYFKYINDLAGLSSIIELDGNTIIEIEAGISITVLGYTGMITNDFLFTPPPS